MSSKQSFHLSAAAAACAALISCSSPSADQPYFGKVQPPDGQVLRYITGSEPESLDPQIGSGQPEARIYVALFDGLTEFDPITGKAIPSLASRWDVSDANTTFTFFLRPEARWSDGSPITADDVVYTVRRGMTPAFASRLSYMAYDIAYAEAFNNGSSFVRDPRTGEFLADPDNPGWRLTVSSAETLTPDLRAKTRDKELVPVKADDIGVEALDGH